MEPCSIFEDLGFTNDGISRGGLPPSPARSGIARRAPFCVSPIPAFTSAPHMGSPSFSVCPAPLPHQESPPEPMAFDIPTSPEVQPILPEPVSPNDRQARTPPPHGAMRPAQVALTAALAAVEVSDLGPSSPALRLGLAAAEEENGQEVTPPKPCGFVSPLQAAAPCERKRPWSPGHRSPYRGGVLSLFTPSPPSPPRRPAREQADDFDPDTIKEMSEDDQLALAISASLQQASGVPPAPPPAAPDPPAPAQASTASSGQADGHALRPVPDASKSLEQSPRASPRFFPSRRTLLSWRRGSRQMQSI